MQCGFFPTVSPDWTALCNLDDKEMGFGYVNHFYNLTETPEKKQ